MPILRQANGVMIEFFNGHKFDFGCASGALGFYGNGWWFEQPWRWIGLLRPEEFTIITKTLTYYPRKGNLRWYAPWRAVRFIENGVVNCVGLTNPGFRWWLSKPYQYTQKKGYKVIPSLAPDTLAEAKEMALAFNGLKIVGIQLNVCPNTEWKSIDLICSIVSEFLKYTEHPTTLKLGENYLRVCQELDTRLTAFELINSVPYEQFYSCPSPLEKYGYKGSVSGGKIRYHARTALVTAKKSGIKTPIISGGANDSYEEVKWRLEHDADGIVFGTLYIKKAWLPNVIVSKMRGYEY